MSEAGAAPPPTLTVAVLTHNEAHRIEACLRSAAFADQLLVVDSGSEDDTVAMARALGAEVHSAPDWQGFAVQRNRLLAHARGDYVFFLDADEVMTPDFARELQAIVRSGAQAVWSIRWRIVAFGHELRRFRAQSYIQRLFVRALLKKSAGVVQEQARLYPLPGGAAVPRRRIQARLQHYSRTTVRGSPEKLTQYAMLGAAKRAGQGRRGGVLRGLASGLWMFLRPYLVRLGFLFCAGGFFSPCGAVLRPRQSDGAGDPPMTAQRWFERCANCGAFMLAGLALWLPSGYSYGAALLLLTAVVSAPWWCRSPAPRAAWWLALVFACMAVLWMLDMDTTGDWGSMDRPLKYLLALPCIFCLMRFAPHASCLWTGIALGAAGGGLIGLYQTQLQCFSPSNGFTNAIQYGALSLLLALMSGLLLLVQYRRWQPWQRWLLALAVLLGGVGSALSQSRGGWLALVLVLPVSAWLLARTIGLRRVCWGMCALLLGVVVLAQMPVVGQRFDQARQEVQTYREMGDDSSSVGQRLAHWRLAWEMGRERPLTGWGRTGYMQEKVRRVAAGLVRPSVLTFGHVHNEVLDLFVKRGIFGVLLLLLFYGTALALFWPAAARIRDAAGKIDKEALSLCLVGVSMPLSYIGFGFLQVFLHLNSGNMFYLFMCPLVLAALQRRRSGGPGPS